MAKVLEHEELEPPSDLPLTMRSGLGGGDLPDVGAVLADGAV